MVRILVGMEESQAITIALREKGHEAFSCDLKPCSGGHPEWHYQCDIYDVLHLNWGGIIMHPECTKLAVSGNRTYAKGKPKHNERIEAAKWTENLWFDTIRVCDRVCFENPVGVLPTMTKMPKPQYVQPYEFGHPETKKTGLFLHGLPDLQPTNIVEPEFIIAKDGRKYSRIHYLTQLSAQKHYGCDRSTARSKTYTGIAKAIADQWFKQ